MTITDIKPTVDAASLLGRCRHRWCTGTYGCVDPTARPEDVAIHEGRASTINRLSLIPFEADYYNGDTYAGPRVAFNGCEDGQIVAELTLAASREVANALARSAAGEVPVGTTERFLEDGAADFPGGASVTVTRDPDETWTYDRRSQPVTYTSVRITVDNPNEPGDALDFEFYGPDAAMMARNIVAIVAEMSA